MKTLGIGIPYYKDNYQKEQVFKYLMQICEYQLTDDMMLVVYEDGQQSKWLKNYEMLNKNIKVIGSLDNMGVSYARNEIINELVNECKYIIFIDSDDRIDNDYFSEIIKHANEDYDIIETDFWINESLQKYQERVMTHTTALALKSSMIKGFYFDDSLQIGEDTDFNERYLKDKTKIHVNTSYYYNYGLNKNSLSQRFSRGEIGERRKNRIC